jgi:hypothetical protein
MVHFGRLRAFPVKLGPRGDFCRPRRQVPLHRSVSRTLDQWPGHDMLCEGGSPLRERLHSLIPVVNNELLKLVLRQIVEGSCQDRPMAWAVNQLIALYCEISWELGVGQK